MIKLNERKMTDYGFDKADIKELEGRYGMKCMIPKYPYDFTKPKFKTYDALSTGKTDELVEEIKTYNDPAHPRYHDRTGSGKKIDDYKLDYAKPYNVKKEAMNLGRIPLLCVFFTDVFVIWDLNKAEWEKEIDWDYGNKYGTNYGEKEWDLKTRLFFDKDKGMIMSVPIPADFWDTVRKEINKNYPGLYE